MSVTLTLDNRFVRVDGAGLKELRAIDKVCSYKVAGYFFSPAYKSRRWDGKEHLFKFTKQHGYRAPSGMAEDIARELKRRGIAYRVKFATKLRGEPQRFKWNAAVKLRGYQEEAVKAALGKPIPGRCTLKMPIRSGKTKTVARILWKLGRPALFVVPSRWILHQTIKSLRECMPNAPIGQIGDGVFDVQFFTVATIQSLATMTPQRADSRKGRPGRDADPRYVDLMNSFDVGVFDEAHHLTGQGDWYRVFVDLNARFKIGVSATIFFDNTKEQENGIIWLRATCGPIRYEVSAGRLIREGYLLPQNVKMYRVARPLGARRERWSQTHKNKCITENKYRNDMIASIVADHSDNGRKTIVIANEHKHIAGICSALEERDVEFRILTGKTSTSKREENVEDFLNDRFHVLVGNVLGEGVDIPDVEVVVNAEGGQDEKKTWQRQRNLTVVEGSSKAPIMIDFYDEMSAIFEKHSKKRLKVYKSESEFKAEVLDWTGTT